MPGWPRTSWNRKADRPRVEPYEISTVATRYSGATTARSSTMSTSRMPMTVISPTFWKSAARVS